MKADLRRIVLLLVVGLMSTAGLPAQKMLGAADSLAILSQFYHQEDAWNDANIERFMQAYWPSEELVFVGADGPTYGWTPVLENYYRRYPDAQSMGKLQFGVLKLSRLDSSAAFLIGTYHLTREMGDLHGVFTLVWRKIEGEWLIVSDHTSASE